MHIFLNVSNYGILRYLTNPLCAVRVDSPSKYSSAYTSLAFLGINLQTLINSACDSQSIVDHFDRNRAIRSIAQSLVDILDLQASERKSRAHPEMTSWRSRFSLCRRYHGCYVTALYLIIKLFYTLNIVLQFLMLNAALKSRDYMLYGFQVSVATIFWRQIVPTSL